MSRLIDADALIPMMKYATTDSDIGVFPILIGFDAIVKVINAQPTIEPQPQRIKGKWIDVTKTGGAELWKCSECGELELEDSYFCPNCGADMRGEQDGKNS